MAESSSDARKPDSPERLASDRLLPLVYRELRQLAKAKLRRERPDHSLQATALVHEAYLRLVRAGSADQSWNGRAHFFAAAAEAMRRILIESARRKSCQKRSGNLGRIQFDALGGIGDDASGQLLALSDALKSFEEIDPVKSQLVKLRFFAGLTQAEAADALGISSTTADRYWAYARAWLQAEMRQD